MDLDSVSRDELAKSVFLGAVEIDPAEDRLAYLDRRCGPDAALRADVETLLRHHEGLGDYLERPAVGPPATREVTVGPSAEGPGTMIGPYKFIEPIGEGGMGSVWMAQQTEPVKRLVAVKLIKAGMDSRQVIARFEAERQALALMDHANIARVLDGGTTGAGRPYFVMDLVTGVPITRYCDEHHLTPRQRLELFIPVCQAVQHAHQKGIIHRDLKPSNVLVALYDGKPVPKIIDFGVAKAAGPQLTDKTLVTGFGAIVGTLEYMSPEQAEINQLDIDTRSDIYSLGVLLYELLTGSPPFSRKELEKAGMLEMLRVIREQEPSKPSTKLSTSDGLPTLAANRGTEPARLTKLVRGELDWIVMKALEKDRNRRYETANGFAMDVQRYLADEPVQACPPSAGYRLSKFVRRNKGGLAVAALVMFFLALLGSGAGWVVRDRSARAGELREAVTAALDKVADLRQRARWGEARAVLEQARQRLGPLGAEDLRRQVERAEADLALVGRLEAARLKASELADARVDSASSVREYVSAFREAGIGEERETIEVVANRIRSSPVREQLVAALDDWAMRVGKEEPARRDWLIAVARGADPDLWRDRFRNAAAWDDRAALERLAREAKVNELSPQVLSALGRLLWARDADATPLLTAAQRRYPSDFWLNFDAGVALQFARRWEEAIGYYRAASALRPATSVVYSNLGMCRRWAGRVDEAVADHRKALELNPRSVHAHVNLGIDLSAKGRMDEAIAEFRKALELDSKNPYAHNGLGDVLRDIGRLDEAIPEYLKALEIDPKYAEAHNCLGLALYTKGRVDEAVAEYRKALELDPKNPDADNNLGNALRAQGHLDEAIAEFRKAIELNFKDVYAHGNLGDALRDKGRIDEAIAEYRQHIQLNPNKIDAYNRLGFALRDKGRTDEAFAEFRKALELDSRNVHAHNGLGVILKDKGQFDEAIAEYQKALEIDPKFGNGHNSLGRAFYKKGRLDESIAEYRKAIELDPKNPFADNNLGVALREKGLLDEAIAQYRKAVELNSKDLYAHGNLGAVLRDQGRFDEAIAEYRKHVELNPTSALAQFDLGMTLKANGDLNGAIAALDSVIQTKPDYSAAHFGLACALADAKQWPRSASIYAAALKRFGAELAPGPWYEAIQSDEVFTRLTAQNRNDRLPWIMRARLRVFQRDWKRAASDYAHVYESLMSTNPAKLLSEDGGDL
jgi:eukaryotic-like serine/threonine-protein kinase